MKKKTILVLIVSFILTQIAVSQTRFGAAQEPIGFKFTTWNTEWLSCSQYGPTDENLQLNNIVTVIKAINPDVLALQEVGTSSLYSTIDTLVRRLGIEWGGAMVASSSYDNCGQNQGLIYKKAKIQFLNASLMTNAGASYDWSSGRFPVLYNINLLAGDTSIPVSFINIHAKAMGDETSYSRRKNASIALKTLLDGSGYNTKRVVVLGDLNDYLVGTQCNSCLQAESPYKNFMDDVQNYKCLTSTLQDPYYGSPVIDNIIISNELVGNYKANSTIRELTATQGVSNYFNTTSDHVPVSAIFSNFTNTSTIAIRQSETIIRVVGKNIRIENQQQLPVTVFDITGRVLFSVNPIQSVEIPVLQSGIYIIRTGNKANKVVVE